MLAGVPTVVYGFFAALTVAPFIRDLGADFGLAISTESALAAGLVMGVMIIPFISSLQYDVITAVPQAMRDALLQWVRRTQKLSAKLLFPRHYRVLLRVLCWLFLEPLGNHDCSDGGGTCG